MSDELRIAFSKKEKVESFLTKLDELKEDSSLSEEQYQDLHREYSVLLEEANASIKETQTRLRKDFHKEAGELEAIQREHDLLQSRFRVGEIRANAFLEQSKPLKQKIELLKKEVANLRKMVEASSAGDIGGTTKVNIPELKIKKLRPKVQAQKKQEEKPEKKTAAAAAKAAPSKDTALIAKLFRGKPRTTTSKAQSIPSAEKSAPSVQVTVEKKAKEHPADQKQIKQGTLIKGAIAAVVLLIVVFLVIGLVIPGVPSPFAGTGGGAAPVISQVAISGINDSSVTVEWSTDKKATSQVILRDPNGTELMSEAVKDLATEHLVQVDGVKPGIKYLVIVKSADAGRNEATYQTEQAFIPGAQVDKTPPVVSNVSVSEITDTGAVISWQTDEPAKGQIIISESDSTTPYLTEIETDSKTEHVATVVNLLPNTAYTFTLLSEDKSGNQAVFSSDEIFTTLAGYPVGPEVGKRAPDFTLVTIDGENLTLSSFRGKAVLVMFWERTCPTCVRELPMLQSVYETLANDNLVVLAVNVEEENSEAVKSFAERWKLGFPILLDTERKVSELYNVSSIPVKVFIDRQGIIKELKVGAFANKEEMEDRINFLLGSGDFK